MSWTFQDFTEFWVDDSHGEPFRCEARLHETRHGDEGDVLALWTLRTFIIKYGVVRIYAVRVLRKAGALTGVAVMETEPPRKGRRCVWYKGTWDLEPMGGLAYVPDEVLDWFVGMDDVLQMGSLVFSDKYVDVGDPFEEVMAMLDRRSVPT